MSYKTYKIAKLAKLTLSISHSLSLNMLNNFCFHVYAQKSMFIAENCNGLFLTSSSAAAPREFANHRAGSQLKRFTTLVYTVSTLQSVVKDDNNDNSPDDNIVEKILVNQHKKVSNLKK